MSSRSVIPPLSVQANPSQQTYGMLQSRLMAAEDDTRQLLNHLQSLGVSPEKPTKDRYGDYTSYTPNKLLNEKNFEEFKNNYEGLVSRVCKNESILQSLKLNFVNYQGDVSLSKKQSADFKEKLQLTREAYEQEIGKLTRQIEYLREEVSTESKAKERAKSEIRELQKVLGDASETRMTAAMAAEELTTSQQKLQKRINDLKEEISREKSLRASLEDSHNTLLTRVREMESIVEVERNEVQSMTQESVSMKMETEKLREDVKEESRKKQVAESSYKMLCEEKDAIEMKYESSESDRQLLLSEMKRLREQYEDLIKQMEQTQAIIDKQQNNNKELVAQNQQLTEVLQVTKEEHERINEDTRRDLEHAKQRGRDKESVEEEAAHLKDSVSDLTEENHELKKKIKRRERSTSSSTASSRSYKILRKKLEEEISKLKGKISNKDEEFTRTADGLERELEAVRDQMKQSQKDRDRTLKDKENLLEEVNQTVDSMVEERALLQKQVQQLQLEVDSHGRARRQLEHENAHLLERVSGFEQQQTAQKHVEKTLKDMMDQKNKLAYENGRLQTQVEQMNSELEALRKAELECTQYKQLSETLQSKYSQALRKAELECTQYKQLSETLQSKYSQCETEISELKITIERQDNQLKQTHASLNSRHQDYTSVRDTKEELQKENQKLLTQLQSVEEREKRKVKVLQKNHEDAKSVNKEIASTLESVMSSHSQLQSVVEGLQIELGKKDSQISRLKNDKNKEQEEWKIEIRRFEERMENLREELRKERDKSQKKTFKDLVEIKKQNDSLSQRNMELMKTNTDLRHKTREQDTHIQELKDKLSEQKRKMEYLVCAKKEMEENVHKMKGMKGDIEDLENLRDTYMGKNREQAEMISTFMGQINSLQTELRQLAHAQSQTSDLVTQRDLALEKEKRMKENIKRKYKESKHREDEIEQMKAAAEKRLADVREESLEITGHLNSAHEWFKDKFDNLQKELTSSRRTQEKMERQNTDQKHVLNSERRRAQDAAEKAKAMIRASRQTISRLSDYAELADQETKEQLNQLYSTLQKEKDHSKFVERKHQQYKDASLRQFENLLHETGDFGDIS